MLVEPFDRIDVGETFEWTGRRSEVRVELLDESFGSWVFEETVYGFANLTIATSQQRMHYRRGDTHDALYVCHQIVECDEREFSF